MMQMVLRSDGPLLQRMNTLPSLTVKQAEVRDKTHSLTIGKVNLIRYEVKRAQQVGPATFFRKGV